jgi:hypothetical protein
VKPPEEKKILENMASGGGWLWKLPRHGGKRFFSRGVLSKRYFTIRGSDSVCVLTWFDEMPGEDGGDAHGCLVSLPQLSRYVTQH